MSKPSDDNHDTVMMGKSLDGNQVFVFRVVLTPKQMTEARFPRLLLQDRLRDLLVEVLEPESEGENEQAE